MRRIRQAGCVPQRLKVFVAIQTPVSAVLRWRGIAATKLKASAKARRREARREEENCGFLKT
jgi:hypothetical protein